MIKIKNNKKIIEKIREFEDSEIRGYNFNNY